MVALLFVGQADAQQGYVGQEVIPHGSPLAPDLANTGPNVVPNAALSTTISAETATVAPAEIPAPYSHAAANHWCQGTPKPILEATLAEMEQPKGPCPEIYGRGENCIKDWYLDQRIRIMYHPKPKREITSYRVEGARSDLAAYTTSPTFESQPGYEVTLGHFLGIDSEDREHYVEFTYYGANRWNSEFTANATDAITETGPPAYSYGNLFSFFPNDISGFNRAETHVLSYSSRWDNFEVNAKIKQRPGKDRLVLHPNGRWRREPQNGALQGFLMGARVCLLDERWGWMSSGEIENTTSGDVDPIGGSYRNWTRNHMWGLQAGYEVNWQCNALQLGIGCKGGLFVNFAAQKTRASSFGSTVDPNATRDLDYRVYASSQGLASLGEVNFSLEYQLRRNLFAHLGYDLMLISGQALAPEQVTFEPNPGARVGNGGILMMQSLSMGLEFVW